MKKLFFTTILLLIFSSSYAQRSFYEGSSQVNLGIELSEYGIPIYGGMDFGINNEFTIGGEISYRNYHENLHNDYYNHNIIGFSGNGNFHFNQILNIPQRFDFYAGLNLGFYVWSSPSGYDGSHSSTLGLGAQIGGRIYFSNNWGLNLEFGGGNSFSGGKAGISIIL